MAPTGRAPLGARRLLTGTTAGRVFATLLFSWVLIGLLSPVPEAQDAIPYAVAGELWLDDPRHVYNGEGRTLYDLNPEFRARSCAVIGDPVRCGEIAVAFISPPTVLPLAGLLAWPGLATAVAAMTTGAGLTLAVAMLALWWRLAPRDHRAPLILMGTALLLTPLAANPIGLGQTSPLMALSVALGTGAFGGRRWRWASEAALGLVIACKALPGLLLGVLVAQRRQAAVARVVAGLALLTVVAVAVGGVDLVSEFLTSTASVNDQTAYNPYNNGLEAVVYRFPGVSVSAETATAVATGLRLVLVPTLAWLVVRRPGDAAWAVAWAALVVVTPLSWWHYVLASVLALGVAIAGSDRVTALLPLLPGAAAVTLVVEVLEIEHPLVRMSFATAVLVAVLRITAPPAGPPVATADPERVPTAAG
jgi:hypothetical protein